jgi:hypothetical protein
MRTAVCKEDTRSLLETIMEDQEAPSLNDPARPWPSAQRHTIDRERDADLSQVLSRTEIMITDFLSEGVS